MGIDPEVRTDGAEAEREWVRIELLQFGVGGRPGTDGRVRAYN
jgi:hypothetical protein